MTKKIKMDIPIEKGSKIFKYYIQRYSLFTKYDQGIRMDEESWYSVTPEIIAEHIAEKVINSLGEGHHIIVDGFCGVGGNLIQFARYSPDVTVIGCDILPKRLEMARHNAKIYGVQDRCEFILGDFMNVMRTLSGRKIDAVFLSPPWGGVDYQALGKYSLSDMTPDGFEIVRVCREYVTDNIALLMPRNVDLLELRKELLDRSHPWFELEQNKLGSKVKTITGYFGNLVDQSCETDVESDNDG